MLVSCTQTDSNKNTEQSIPEDIDTLELQPDFSYEVIPQTPHIRIDKVGYLPDRKKTAFIVGKDLSLNFSVMNKRTKEVSFQGKLMKVGKADENGDNLYLGDFTKLAEDGTYEIYQPDVGNSYPFEINNSVYNNVSNSLYRIVRTYHYETVGKLSYVLGNIMLTKEIYPNSEDNYFYIKKQMALLIEQQNKKTGAVNLYINNNGLTGDTVMGETLTNDTSIPEINTKETVSLTSSAEFAGVMAQYYNNYKDYDKAFANQCLQAATKAYNYMEKYRDNTSTDSWYYAATQLYRVTGSYKYKAAIKEYDDFSMEKRTVSEYDFTLLGDLAYLSTSYHTNLSRCQNLMNQYLQEAQEISYHSSKEHFYVQENIDIMSEDELLNKMMVLGVVNYVLSGREYAGIQENYIHYFFGVNDSLKNRLTEDFITTADTDPMKKNISKISELIFVLGNVSNKY